MLNDDTGSIMFSTVSPDPFTSVKCAQGKPALSVGHPNSGVLVANANRAPWCRAVSTEPTEGHQATLMKSVSDCLVRDIHTSGLLEVIV